MAYCGANPWDGDGIDKVRPECVHPEHWLAVNLDLERGGWLDYDDPPALCRWAQVQQYCDLDAGHAGPHEWPGLKQLVPTL
jgi:hypothetical protein